MGGYGGSMARAIAIIGAGGPIWFASYEHEHEHSQLSVSNIQTPWSY